MGEKPRSALRIFGPGLGSRPVQLVYGRRMVALQHTVTARAPAANSPKLLFSLGHFARGFRTHRTSMTSYPSALAPACKAFPRAADPALVGCDCAFPPDRETQSRDFIRIAGFEPLFPKWDKAPTMPSTRAQSLSCHRPQAPPPDALPRIIMNWSATRSRKPPGAGAHRQIRDLVAGAANKPPNPVNLRRLSGATKPTPATPPASATAPTAAASCWRSSLPGARPRRRCDSHPRNFLNTNGGL